MVILEYYSNQYKPQRRYTFGTPQFNWMAQTLADLAALRHQLQLVQNDDLCVLNLPHLVFGYLQQTSQVEFVRFDLRNRIVLDDAHLVGVRTVRQNEAVSLHAHSWNIFVSQHLNDGFYDFRAVQNVA